jgi:hypothetical protein
MSTSFETSEERAYAQLLFDRTYTAFVYERSAPAALYTPSGVLSACLYRGPNGSRCALGLHIPDVLYKPEMECNDSNSLLESFSELAFLKPYKQLLRELQCVHDTSAVESSHYLGARYAENDFTDRVACRLNSLAKLFGFTLPPHPEG